MINFREIEAHNGSMEHLLTLLRRYAANILVMLAKLKLSPLLVLTEHVGGNEQYAQTHATLRSLQISTDELYELINRLSNTSATISPLYCMLVVDTCSVKKQLDDLTYLFVQYQASSGSSSKKSYLLHHKCALLFDDFLSSAETCLHNVPILADQTLFLHRRNIHRQSLSS